MKNKSQERLLQRDYLLQTSAGLSTGEDKGFGGNKTRNHPDERRMKDLVANKSVPRRTD
jgi:hypothetical protein